MPKRNPKQQLPGNGSFFPLSITDNNLTAENGYNIFRGLVFFLRADTLITTRFIPIYIQYIL